MRFSLNSRVEGERFAYELDPILWQCVLANIWASGGKPELG